jgi:hypothetical protein
MKIFIESTWAPWEIFPSSIDEYYQVSPDRVTVTQNSYPDLMAQPFWNSVIRDGLMVPTTQHTLDYLRKNTDDTTSIGFYAFDQSLAGQWIQACSTKQRPSQIQHVVVVIPEEGDDLALAQPSYQDKLNAGLIMPFAATFRP